jgi:hypothetical protein
MLVAHPPHIYPLLDRAFPLTLSRQGWDPSDPISRVPDSGKCIGLTQNSDNYVGDLHLIQLMKQDW